MANVKRLTGRSKSRRKTASEELEVGDETDGNGNEEGRGEQAQEQRKQDDPNSQRQRRSLYNQFISTVTHPFSSLGLSRQATEHRHRSDNIERSTREMAYDIPRQVYRRVRIMADRDVHQYPVFTKSIQYDKVQSRTQGNPWRKHGVVSKLSEIGGTFVPKSTGKNKNRHKSNVEIAKGSAPPADPRCPAILLNYDPIMKIRMPASPLGIPAQEAAHLIGNQIHQLVVSRGYNLNKTHNDQSASRRTTVSLPQSGLDRMGRGERPGQSNRLSGSSEAPRSTSRSQTHRESSESVDPTPVRPPSQSSLNPRGSEELSGGSEEAEDSPSEVIPSKRSIKRRHRLG